MPDLTTRHAIAALAAVILVALVLPAPLDAEDRRPGGQSDRAMAEAQFKTLYHAASDTYFELARSREPELVTWEEARVLSRHKRHKGRRGRLAIVDTPERHRWLMRHFNLNALGYGGRTWIGLQYWCSYRALTWVNGVEHPFSGFSVWDTPWYREDGIRCGLQPELVYMGVYYEAATHRWRAVAARKRFPYFLVEYPPAE